MRWCPSESRSSLVVVIASLVGTWCSIAGCNAPNCNVCPQARTTEATLTLSCGPSDLTAIRFGGPCPSDGDGSVGDYVKGFQDRNVSFGATSAGTCDVTLVFATGFTYSTAVTFTETNNECPDCPSMLSPSPAVVTVQNPSSTCMAEGGADASVLDASLR